jgi:hypothetical protein
MKKILSIISLGIILMSFNNFGNSDDIITALKSGTAAEVSQYFDNFIDFTLPEKEEMKNMGKNQAGIALKAYYQEIGVKTFQLTSQREAGSTMYITGKLQGKTKNSNLTIILKNTNSKYIITSIRIG